jgi:hypothetical protein
MNTYTYSVTLYAPSADEAEQVMAERLGHDEDYGFDYEISGYVLQGTSSITTITLANRQCLQIGDVVHFDNGSSTIIHSLHRLKWHKAGGHVITPTHYTREVQS